MLFPDFRGRRLRSSPNFRRMIRETSLSRDDLILPMFAIEGQAVKKPIESMPGHFQLSVDHIVKLAKTAHDEGIPGIILFGIPDKKDPLGTRAYAPDGIVQRAVKEVKSAVPDITVITDVCCSGTLTASGEENTGEWSLMFVTVTETVWAVVCVPSPAVTSTW